MSSPLAIKALREQLLANGFRFVPCLTSSKNPAGKDWPAVARSLVSVDWPDGAALTTGILADGLAPIDVDVNEPELARWIVQLALDTLGNAPKRSRANSPRCLLLYRAAEDSIRSANVSDANTKKILEVLGSGRQFIAYGTHPSGVDYTWDYDLRSIRRDQLTSVSSEQIGSFLEVVAKHVGGRASRSTQQADVKTVALPVAVGKRERAAAAFALKSEVAKLTAMGAGQHRNEALNNAAFALGTLTIMGWIDAKEVAHALLGAAVSNGYVDKRGEDAAKHTIMSGLNAGALKPRGPLPDEDDELMDISNLMIGGKTIDQVLAELEIGSKPRKPKLAAPVVKTGGKRSVVLTGLAGVQETPVEWLWHGYLPAGMLTLLSGAGGTGKSTLAFGFAATITTGGQWPDGKRNGSRGNVLIWSSEDDIARTIKPRLMAAGADISRIAAIESTTNENGEKLPFDPACDIDSLRAAVRDVGGISLLIIDPIVSAVSGDMHKANDVRRSLQPIVDFAAEFNCAVIGITHFAKNTGGRNASERVIGSQAFAALARMVLVTAKEEDSEQRVFTRAKSNISADDGGIHYTIEQVTVPSGNGAIETTRLIWGEAIQGNARSILSSVEGDVTEHYGTKIDEAKNFLFNTLAYGPMSVTQIKAQAKDAHITSVTLQRAKEALKVQSAKSKGEFTGSWDWFLPSQPDKPALQLLR